MSNKPFVFAGPSLASCSSEMVIGGSLGGGGEESDFGNLNFHFLHGSGSRTGGVGKDRVSRQGQGPTMDFGRGHVSL